MGINLMADLGLDDDKGTVKHARRAASMYAEVIDSLVAARKKQHGLTQKKVAKRMETTQSAVSEFESVNSDVRFSTLIRYAQAVGCDMVIELEHHDETPAEQKSAWVELKMVASGKVIPFMPKRYQHNPARLDALAMSHEPKLLAQ